MKTISLNAYAEQVASWIAENGLDAYFGKLYPEHDTLHVVFGLTINEEGLVLAVENCIDHQELGSVEEFTRLAFALAIETDTFSKDRAREVFRELESNWPVTIIGDR